MVAHHLWRHANWAYIPLARVCSDRVHRPLTSLKLALQQMMTTSERGGQPGYPSLITDIMSNTYDHRTAPLLFTTCRIRTIASFSPVNTASPIKK